MKNPSSPQKRKSNKVSCKCQVSFHARSRCAKGSRTLEAFRDHHDGSASFYREIQGLQLVITCLEGTQGNGHPPTRGQIHGSVLSSFQSRWYNYCELWHAFPWFPVPMSGSWSTILHLEMPLGEANIDPPVEKLQTSNCLKEL